MALQISLVGVVGLGTMGIAHRSCMCSLNVADCISPLTPYFVMKIDRLPLLPYHCPGDPALARQHMALLLVNYVPVVSGVTLEAVVHAAEELEASPKRFLLLRDVSVRALDVRQIEDCF